MTKAYGASIEEYKARVENRRKVDLRKGDEHCYFVKEHGFDGLLFCGLVRAHDGQHEDSYGDVSGEWCENRKAVDDAMSLIIIESNNSSAYTASDLERAVSDALEKRDSQGLLVERLTAWLKSINAYDEDTPLSEMCKRAVSLALAAEREAIAKLVEQGYRCLTCESTDQEHECKYPYFQDTSNRDLAAAIRARSETSKSS